MEPIRKTNLQEDGNKYWPPFITRKISDISNCIDSTKDPEARAWYRVQLEFAKRLLIDLGGRVTSGQEGEE